MESDNKVWAQLNHCLPYKSSPEDLAARKKIWQAIDANGNGYLSLAEIDRGLQEVVQLPILFDLKPVIIRAFTAAKNKLKSKSKVGDDYVSWAEFRFLLSYLRQYYEYWIAFQRIDKDGDRRVTINEFRKAVPLIAKWGIKIQNPDLTFKQIDKDGGGMILFNEFCQWAIKQNLDLDDDDDAEVLN